MTDSKLQTEPARAADHPGGQPPGAPERRASQLAARPSELVLVVAFLALLGAVPVIQSGLELARHERVQFTDVVRYRPTANNLRQFEATLKEKSWFQQKLRPQVQRALFTTLRDPGAKGLLGRDQWLFYRPDVRYLLEPNRPEPDWDEESRARPGQGSTQRESVERAIIRFRDQLQERGTALVVVPVPGKPSVYPDQVTARAIGPQQEFPSPTLDLLAALRRQGVAVVDLFTVFRAARGAMAGQTAGNLLYLARDTHWTPRGAELAAQSVAARLRELGLAPPPAREFRTQRLPVRRWGDVLEMMQVPGLRATYPPELVQCEQVLDPARGPLVPAATERPGAYRSAGQKAAVLVLGDSFSRIYQYPEPQTLGEPALSAEPGVGTGKEAPTTKRLLPGSAGFISHLALALKSPVDAIYSDGGASTDVRRKLSTNPEILEGKKVVVWEFVERDVALGQAGWEHVPLPAKLD